MTEEERQDKIIALQVQLRQPIMMVEPGLSQHFARIHREIERLQNAKVEGVSSKEGQP